MNKELDELKVKDVMTRELIKFSPKVTLREARELFAKYKIRHAPVVRNGELVGIVSLTDIQRMTFNDAFGDSELGADQALSDMLTVWQIMKQNPVTADEEDSVRKAAEILTHAEFHALPVLRDKKLTGIVTSSDIIRTLLKICE